MPGGAFGPLVAGGPVVPDALALDATGAVTALDSNGTEIEVFGAPPGSVCPAWDFGFDLQRDAAEAGR